MCLTTYIPFFITQYAISNIDAIPSQLIQAQLKKRGMLILGTRSHSKNPSPAVEPILHSILILDMEFD
ncbi:MAG: hypothetical protein F6K41_06255 [Symploca sp. SIO3E6]|nr:hypothetical protein [Caldora sp. SIO3E6]